MQPIGAERSPLGDKVEVVKTTGSSLLVPCYLMDSSKPIWHVKLEIVQ